MNIKQIKALEILDSRSNPTVMAMTELEDGSVGQAAVPSGASTGSHEAVELRDHDPKRFAGNGVLQAVSNVDLLSTLLTGKDAADQTTVDKIMIEADGTENKSHLGANALLAVSLSVARAEAVSEKLPLYRYLSKFNPNFRGQFTMPMPQMNVINGGKHGNWSTDIQEYMIIPVGATKFSQALRMGSEIYQSLKSEIKAAGYAITVGDEGGFAPQFNSNAEPFEMLLKALQKSGYEPRKDVAFAIDPAASEFYENGLYDLKKEHRKVTTAELEEYYLHLKSLYPIVSMEDFFAEDDWDGFVSMTAKVGNEIQIMGDDLYVTNVKRLQMGIDRKATNSILIKVNQIGTLSETVNAILLARSNGMAAIVSHRSGETEDTFIADLVVAMGTGQIKTGAPCRSERVAKYNRLLQIEWELGDATAFAPFPFAV
jgi:enolase